uniref:Uncharacterized protein n=1 Tax=Anguilla anguilla TaxID=7936 RepID=A0A0E9TLT0_ANGAN
MQKWCYLLDFEDSRIFPFFVF